MRRDLAVLLTLMIAVALFAGCGGKKPPENVPTAPAGEATDPGEAPAPVVPPPPPPPSREIRDDDFPGAQEQGDMQAGVLSAEEIARINIEGEKLRTVYFGFDRHDLSSSTVATLKENAEWLKAYPGLRVVIQGHCDERGTIEYNLALGERRARSVREYFAALGLDASRFRIVTYGEEQPAPGATGHDEAAWSRNRRAEFLIEQ